MLNYDTTTGKTHSSQEDELEQIAVSSGNPFPGLRPFKIEESHLFFGREKEVYEILEKLENHRFVTVVGYSGSGKSSLVRCGVVPVLYGGFIKSVGPNWQVVNSRPGIDPFHNLADSILKLRDDYHELDEKDLVLNRTVIYSLLKSGPQGFIDAIKTYQKKTSENILLLIDQFEELFRYEGTEESSFTHHDASEYVQLLLNACQQDDIPVSVVLTLRSDYVGRCSDFQGLTDRINESNYLVPQMSRNEKKMAIEGPVAVGGGKISTRLINRMLNDIGDHQDQLPILQHVMMRTWEHWLVNREETEPIDIRHYMAVGSISEALSQHADEAYEQLDQRQKEIAEVLFKTLTIKTSENQGMRNAAKISLITEISGASEEEVIEVVEEFRKPGRSFLMPPPPKELTSDTRIEISHESLMRIWTRLKVWVDEEYESAQMYKRLSEAAAMYQTGKTGLWRPPDLQLALNWQKKQRPTRAWAQRYDEAFERAIVFLDTSRITYEAEQKNQELIQKRLLRRTRIVAVILGIAAIISILFFVFAITQMFKAEENAIQALKNEKQAILNAEEAEEARIAAEKSEREAREANAQLIQTLSMLEDSTYALSTQRASLQQALLAEQEAQLLAQERADEAQKQTIIAQSEAERATRQYELANRLLKLNVAQTMAIKSQFIEDDPDLRTVVAMQAYKYHSENEGRENDPYVYNALHDALDELYAGQYNTFDLGNDPLRGVVYDENYLYTTSSNGNIYKVNKNDANEVTVLHANSFPNRNLLLGNNGQFLVNSSDSTFLQVINTSGGINKRITGHPSFVIDMVMIPGTNEFYSLDKEGQIRKNSIDKSTNQLIKQLNFPAISMSISPDGQKLILGTEDSRVFVFDLNTRKPELIIEKGKNNFAHSVAFHPNGKLIAIGYEKGMVDLYDLSTRYIVKTLVGHKGRVNELGFSPDGKYLVTSSWDRSMYLWVLNELNELPTQLEDHQGFVWDISFSSDSEYVAASLGSGELKRWALTPDTMAENVCDLLFRNMSNEEWRIYAGTQLEYEKTCEDLPDMF